MKKKQQTGKPGRPKEVTIHGSDKEPIPVNRVTARGSGGGTTILSRTSKPGSPTTKQDTR